MDIEFVGTTIFTVTLDDTDMEKVKKWLKENPDEIKYLDEKELIVKAVSELYSAGEIEPYDKGKCIESDFYTEDIRWSEFEEREPEEILGELQ